MSDRPNLFIVLYALLAHRITRQVFYNVRQTMFYLTTHLPLYDFGGLTLIGLFLLAITVVEPSFWSAIHLIKVFFLHRCLVIYLRSQAELKGYIERATQVQNDNDPSFMSFGNSSCNILSPGRQLGWKLNPAHVQLLESCYCTWLQCAL